MKSDIRVEHVNQDRFIELAISRQSLQRADDPFNGIRGLLDVEKGIRYIINEQNLFPPERLNIQTQRDTPIKPR